MVAPLVMLLVAEVPLLSSPELLQRAENNIRAARLLKAEPDKAIPLLEDALACYEQIHSRGARNAELYQNLGNVYSLLGRLPEAILAYRKGLELSPTSTLLRENLRLAREKVVYSSNQGFARPPEDTRPPWLPRFRLKWWIAILPWLCYLAGCVFLTRWWMTRRKPLRTAAALNLGIATILAITVMALDYYDRPDTDHPIVVIREDGVLLRKGNGLAYPPAYPDPVNRGAEARLLHQKGLWSQIELGSGDVGWVFTEYLIRDIPPSQR